MATVTDRIKESGVAAKDRGVVLLDSYVPPSQRRELSEGFKEWSANNPKTAVWETKSVNVYG